MNDSYIRFSAVGAALAVTLCTLCLPAQDPIATLIIHGDKDPAVPIQQSETIVARFHAVGVPTELVVKEGAGHGWPELPEKDMPTIIGWFDKHLEKR